MDFFQAIRTCMGKYATFKGRATRSEYWFFVLFLFLASSALEIVDGMIFSASADGQNGGDVVQVFGVFSPIFSLATTLPMIAAGWRRMHDSGRSGLHLLYPFIAAVGVTSYLSLIGGLSGALEGDFGQFVDTIGGLIALAAMIVLILSPLIVIWWLTRPSQPGPNAYGP